MYDTVHFWIDKADIPGGNPLGILPYLSNETEHNSENRGSSYSGTIENILVHVFEAGISLKGSLAKYYFGNNVEMLTRKDTQRAIEKLSEALHIDIRKAKVRRLDVAMIVYTQRPPADYYSYLGQKSRFLRLQATDNTLYYNTKKKQLIFYNKTKEAKEVYPNDFEDDCYYALRYELRFLKRLREQLKTDVTGAMLYNFIFYYRCLLFLKTEFNSIAKINKLGIGTDGITTPHEAKEALFARLLQEKGQTAITDFLSDLKAANALHDKKAYSRLKSSLNKIIAAPSAQKSSPIQELETGVETTIKCVQSMM